MITRRLSTLMADAFKDAKLQEKCIKSFNTHLENGNGFISRSFDDFPQHALIDPENFKEIRNEFRKLLEEISKNNHLDTLTKNEKKQIEGWGKKIANLGIHSLLTREGFLQEAFLDLLRCDAYRELIHDNNVLLISAYVGAINQSLMDNSEKETIQLILANQQAYDKIFREHFNRNYRNWGFEVMKKLGVHYHPKFDDEKTWNSIAQDVLSLPKNNPGFFAALFGGGIGGVALYGGFKLFQQYQASKAKPTEKKQDIELRSFNNAPN